MLKITVNKDGRGLKAGKVYDFTEALDDFWAVTIVGNNGCGKSTLLQALRGVCDKRTKTLHMQDFKALAKDFTIEADYEEILFLDRVKDSGTDFMNAADASMFIENAGIYAAKISHGEGALMYLSKFMKDNERHIVPKKTLIVLDEVDGGLSLVNSSKFINFVRNMIFKHRCHILAISHNPFFILDSVACYDFETDKFMGSGEYIAKATGFSMERVKVDQAEKV